MRLCGVRSRVSASPRHHFSLLFSLSCVMLIPGFSPSSDNTVGRILHFKVEGHLVNT